MVLSPGGGAEHVFERWRAPTASARAFSTPWVDSARAVRDLKGSFLGSHLRRSRKK